VATWIAAITGLTMALSLTGSAHAHELEMFTGLASFYSNGYDAKTANGGQYDPKQFTAAHATLPFGTRLRVSDLCNDRAVTVVVTDRGPFIAGRVLDVSMAAAKALGMIESGTLRVVAVVEQASAIHLRALQPGY
jgi:rare lipoprotein A